MYVSRNLPSFSLNKDEKLRPKYKKLLEHPFVQKAKEAQQAENAIAYLSEFIDRLAENTDTFELYYYSPSPSSATPRWLNCSIAWFTTVPIVESHLGHEKNSRPIVHGFPPDNVPLFKKDPIRAHSFLTLFICSYFCFFSVFDGIIVVCACRFSCVYDEETKNKLKAMFSQKSFWRGRKHLSFACRSMIAFYQDSLKRMTTSEGGTCRGRQRQISPAHFNSTRATSFKCPNLHSLTTANTQRASPPAYIRKGLIICFATFYR